MNSPGLAAEVDSILKYSACAAAMTPEARELLEAVKRKADAGSETAEEWWTRHATLLAQKMRQGGVRLFRVELTPRGTYEFEVDPIEPPNATGSATPEDSR